MVPGDAFRLYHSYDSNPFPSLILDIKRSYVSFCARANSAEVERAFVIGACFSIVVLCDLLSHARRRASDKRAREGVAALAWRERSQLFWEIGRDKHRNDADCSCRRLSADARSREIFAADHRQAARSQASVATRRTTPTPRLLLTPSPRHTKEIRMLPIHILAAIVVLLVVYLFYAVINPERF